VKLTKIKPFSVSLNKGKPSSGRGGFKGLENLIVTIPVLVILSIVNFVFLTASYPRACLYLFLVFSNSNFFMSLGKMLITCLSSEKISPVVVLESVT
jgi:hypothetical protein